MIREHHTIDMPMTSMLKKLLCVCALILGWSLSHAAEPMPKVSKGRIERIENVPSKFVDPRHVDVWLPEGYTTARRYAVLYMHDGQMLYDASTTWNRQAWYAQDTMQRLMDEGRIRDTLIVGIRNNGKFRHSEYFPQKFLGTVDPGFRRQFEAEYLQGKPQSDHYLSFVVKELKPMIDARYATRPERENTFIAGSSMGGMISVYAMNEYPEIFGGAAGLSIAWISRYAPNHHLPLAGFNYLHQHLAPPLGHRLYMDHGTAGFDALYGVYQAFVDEIVRGRGYEASNWQTRVFPGTDHTEKDWAARLDVPLLFLLRR